nr:protein Dok-7 isoform X1 [Misgurnus anguillicaudatus]
MCDTVIAEGPGKIRDGKKWKSRWLVLRKPSPVADCLVLYVYKQRGVKERGSVTLEQICGLEARVCGDDAVTFILSIICLTHTAVLGFDSREALQSWDLRLRYCLGEVHSFNVFVLPGTKLESGPATLHLCNNLLVIAKDLPAVITGHWNLLDLRRYGPVSNGFVFEGGTRCGVWAGVFFLASSDGEQISFLCDCIVRGISPSRGPFGLKPLLPECGTSAVSLQDRLNHEAEELERRISLLSYSSASSSSVGSSVTGDTCSISGSSDTSECSISSRPVESVPLSSSETSHPITPRTASQGEEAPSDSLRVPEDLIRSRKLKEIGRQNSSDSGIATGSFSSYSGSLDACVAGDDHNTLLNLPPPANPEQHLCTCPPSPAHEYQVPSSLRYLYDTPRKLLEITRTAECSGDKRRSADDTGCPESGQTELSVRTQSQVCSEFFSQSDSDSALMHTGEGLKKGEGPPGMNFGETADCSHPAVSRKSLFITCSVCGGLKTTHLPEMTPLSIVSGKQSAPPTSDVIAHPTHQESEAIRKPCISSTFHNQWKLTSERSQTNGYVSGLSDLLTHYSPAEQHRSVYESMSSSVVGLESRRPAHSTHALLYENCLHCRRGENRCHLPKINPTPKDQESEELKRNQSNISESLCFSDEKLSVSLQQTNEEDKRTEKGTDDPEAMQSQMTERSSESIGGCSGSKLNSHHLIEGGLFAFPLDGLVRGDSVMYVNIPISPVSKKQLNYMEVEHQEPCTPIRGRSSSKYAQIDITATEAAHRAGTQHALGREEGLQRRRGGAPQ